MTQASVLLADPRMPGISLLSEPSRLRDVIEAHVAPSLLGGRRLVAAEVSAMTYRPLRQCFALCSISFEDGTDAALIISFAKENRVKLRVYDRHYAGKRVPQAVYLEEHDALFERFPSDWAVPALARLFDPAGLKRLVRSAAIPDLEKADFNEPPVIISYRPHEAAVLTFPGLVAGSRTLVAKAFAEHERALRLHRSAARLRRSMPGETVWTPPTFRPRNQKGAVFMAHAAGTPVFESPDIPRALGLAGAALAAIHRTPISRHSEAFSVDAAIRRAAARMDRVALVSIEIADRARSLLLQVANAADEFTVRPAFLHGDYKGAQLLIDGNTAAVIDLDSTKVGDPAVDIGNFLADLHREAVVSGHPELRTMAPAFLQGYEAEGGNPAAFPAAHRFKVAALARMAMHSFRQNSRRQADYDAATPHALLDEAEDCLKAL